MNVMACQCQIVIEMVEMASHFNDEYKKFTDSRPKGKAKKSFSSWFSFSSTQGSDSSRSFGKKRKERVGGTSGGRHSFTGFSQVGFSASVPGGWTCFICGQAGHVVDSCPCLQQALTQVACYNCGKPGHV